MSITASIFMKKHNLKRGNLYRFSERWNDLLSFMLEEGYVLTDLHEHFFQKGEIGINFA